MNNNIKELRKNRKLRQEDLAEKLGVTRQTIIAIENDKYDPTFKVLSICVVDMVPFIDGYLKNQSTCS